MIILKDIYKDLFKVGAAVESIHDKFTNNEIGDPEKEKLLLSQFGSMTFGNELKPAYNMGFASPEAREDYLPFVINPNAKKMLDFAKQNGMPVRGHVLIWHSQCADEAFCKGYRPVRIPTDPELLKKNPMLRYFEPLDPVCFVDRDTMIKRMKSYIFTLMEYMYKNGYADVIYAWDVVNEAIELADKTPTGLRNSYWYRVVGDDFMYFAFRFAKEAALKYSVEYAEIYGIGKGAEDERERIIPKLFYNDYNEFQPEKKKAIIEALKRGTDEHGSIIGEGLIDGIGMQGHLSDNNDPAEYADALRDYAALVKEVHVTELDVKCTCTNINREYYQAVFYKALFEEFVKAVKEGINLTSVTFWGLTDDNSWIRGADPLVFRGDLSPKRSFDAVVYAICGGDLGEPEKVICDLSEKHYDFGPGKDEKPFDAEAAGFKMRGFGDMSVRENTGRNKSCALVNEKRFGDWCGITYDASELVGQTVEICAVLKCEAKEVVLNADFGGKIIKVGSTAPEADLGDKTIKAESTAPETDLGGGWKRLCAQVKIPANLRSAILIFTVMEAPGEFNALYIDEFNVKPLGMFESFEEEKHIASIRGMGHLPFITVTGDESRDGRSKSLLVTRHEKDATVKLGISSYIGHTADITVYVKTSDRIVRMGLDGAVPTLLTEVRNDKENGENGWILLHAKAVLPEELHTAEIYIETDGKADMYLDDITVLPGEVTQNETV